MRLLIKLLFCFSVFTTFSQEIETEKKVAKVDSLYREDQFYASMSFSMMQTKPQSYSVTKLSAGFSAGFLRDMPINKSRTIAIAAGLGASYNKFVHNLIVTKPASEIIYSVISPSDFDKNKLEKQINPKVPMATLVITEMTYFGCKNYIANKFKKAFPKSNKKESGPRKGFGKVIQAMAKGDLSKLPTIERTNIYKFLQQFQDDIEEYNKQKIKK